MSSTRPASSASGSSERHPARVLSVWDAISISVGIIIGSAIYESAPRVAENAAGWVHRQSIERAAQPFRRGTSSQHARAEEGSSTLQAEPRREVPRINQLSDAPPASSPSQSFSHSRAWWAGAAVLAVWVVGGLLALVGALCVAELATAWPQAGGPYVYLSQTLGRGCGFAFAWIEFWIVRPGNLGAVAFVLARYALGWRTPGSTAGMLAESVVACLAILGLAIVNAAGLRAGKRVQNLLTVAKVAGLGGVCLVSLGSTAPYATEPAPLPAEGSLALALILVMFAYGGWADISLVAAEVRHPQRNLLRALIGSTMLVASLYVLLNAAFLHSLGVAGMTRSQAVAAEVMGLRLGLLGRQAISLLVVVSCLGALNGMLLSGVRVPYALGRHHPAFRWLGAWHAGRGVPLRSLMSQTSVTLGLIAIFGRDARSFERLVVFTAPFYWGFIALVGVALLVRRWKLPALKRGFQVPLYPFLPLVFIASSGWMAWVAGHYALKHWSLAGWWLVVVIVSGVVVGRWERRHRDYSQG